MHVTAPADTRPRAQAEPPGGRAAWIAWGIAASAYLVDLTHRMSLGVAGLDAEQRLGVGAGAIAVLAALQLGVYVLGQVPAGLLADRVGPRRTLVLGLLLMSVGEGIFALSASFGPSLAGRLLIGAGDATIFLSVLRVAASWFPRRQFGLVTALTALIGCAGQLVTTVPLTTALDGFGWTATFGGGALLSVAVAAVIWVSVRERPPGVPAPSTHRRLPVVAGLRAAWAKPTTRRGCLTHFALMTPFGALGTMWAHPFLVETAGLSHHVASTVLLAGVVATGLAAPAIGLLAARRRAWRGRAAALIAGSTTVALTLLLALAGTAPPAVLALLLGVTAVGMPASMLGFDIAREGDDGHDSGAVAALVNLGGWSGTVVLLAALAVSHQVTDSRWMLLPLIAVSAVATLGLIAQTDWRRPVRRARARLVPA